MCCGTGPRPSRPVFCVFLRGGGSATLYCLELLASWHLGKHWGERGTKNRYFFESLHTLPSSFTHHILFLRHRQKHTYTRMHRSSYTANKSKFTLKETLRKKIYNKTQELPLLKMSGLSKHNCSTSKKNYGMKAVGVLSFLKK